MTITVALTTAFIIWTAIQGLLIIALIVGAWWIISNKDRFSGPPIYLATGPDKNRKRRKRK
jgi:hypothetical protein